jgi:hypothetical protein
MSLFERIQRGEAAIAAAKALGRNVEEWEEHLEQLKCEALAEELPPRAWIHEHIRDESGNLQAIVICSEPLDDFLYVVLRRGFEPREPHAIYYPDELEFLRTKTFDELKAVHQTKLAFPGCRVIQ